MSTIRNGLLGASVALLITAGLFATGVAKMGSREDNAAPTAHRGVTSSPPLSRRT